ncbi:MAG: CBS domain-containing protein [Nitrospinota bacterium]
MIKVKDRMATGFQTLDDSSTTEDVAKVCAAKKIGSVFITKGGDVKGIVTETDLVQKVIAKGLSYSSTLASDIMSTKLITVEKNASLVDAGDMMDRHHVRHLGVTDGSDKIIGIISVRDLIHPIYTDGEGW